MKERKELEERITLKEQRKLELHLLKQYREYLLRMEKSLATIDKYLRDIRTFDRWLGEDKRISKERIIAYKACNADNTGDTAEKTEDIEAGSSNTTGAEDGEITFGECGFHWALILWAVVLLGYTVIRVKKLREDGEQ